MSDASHREYTNQLLSGQQPPQDLADRHAYDNMASWQVTGVRPLVPLGVVRSGSPPKESPSDNRPTARPLDEGRRSRSPAGVKRIDGGVLGKRDSDFTHPRHRATRHSAHYSRSPGPRGAEAVGIDQDCAWDKIEHLARIHSDLDFPDNVPSRRRCGEQSLEDFRSDFLQERNVRSHEELAKIRARPRSGEKYGTHAEKHLDMACCNLGRFEGRVVLQNCFLSALKSAVGIVNEAMCRK